MSDAISEISQDAKRIDGTKKIGILGGTFDPIHSAHLACANIALNELGLDEVVLVPASISPFKQDRELAAFEHRYKMCEMAVDSLPGLEISDIENRRPGVSYTVDTISELLSGDYEGDELYFIIGSDAFLGLPKWKDSDRIAELVNFAVLMRNEDDSEAVTDVSDSLNARTFLLDAPRIDVSSSDIRRAIANGESVKGSLPEAVYEYIQTESLYDVQKAKES